MSYRYEFYIITKEIFDNYYKKENLYYIYNYKIIFINIVNDLLIILN